MVDKNMIAVSAYNKVAEEYCAKYFNDDFDFPVLEEFITKLPKTGFVLDVGCGPGTFTQHFLKHGFKVEGIDLSEKMLEIAKRNIPFVNFKLMDMRNLRYFDESFDGIFAGYSLIHIPGEDIEKTLEGFYRVMEKNGFLMISAQSGEGEKVIDEPLAKGVKIFFNFYRLDELAKLIEQAGFEVVYKQETELLEPEGSSSDKVNYIIAKKL
ncbi:class I SAM-dependent methyltransferase [Candidatus Dojkabacteria bacterium]|nr:class I SAM-dependent methyltransferase [Candidatus Dojkabacteria bacterium]